MFAERLQQVEERIQAACLRAGRRREDITLLAVTKVFPAAAIREAYEHGLRDFGENYVQELALKAPDLAGCREARFHLIGHLQSNKARRAVGMFHVIQTVDSGKLARKLDECERAIDVMIEVKLSAEETKSGADPEAVASLVDYIRGCRFLRLGGLMTMPPWTDDPEVARPYFRRLRGLAEAHKLSALSRGMSHDFEAAIEEGATHIRVGTALFGPRGKT
ncbi:MAG: YggS family pyridoxal phosphate-dependent enzyme [Bryobacteraceae bacterium]